MLYRFIKRTLDTRITPVAYIVAFSSLAIGFSFTFLGFLPDVQNTLLYKNGVFLDLEVWGILLFISSAFTLIGMKFHFKTQTSIAAFFTTVLWMFGAATYLLNGFFYAFVATGLLYVLVHGWIYISAALDMLWEDRLD